MIKISQCCIIPNMENSYQDPKIAKYFIDFLNSKDGEIYKETLSQEVFERISQNKNQTVLDAGSGLGWLTNLIHKAGYKVKGLDSSAFFIDIAKKNFPNIPFICADLNKSLPYPNQEFDLILSTLSILDIKNLKFAINEFSRILKPNGKILIITVNPYYGYPVGNWKRGLLRILLGKKPVLKLKSYFNFQRQQNRAFEWNHGLTSYFYTLPEIVNSIIESGFKLKFLKDIQSTSDDKTFSLRYKLYRFPIFLLMEFNKD